MKNVNVNLSIEVNVNVDGERAGGFSSKSQGIPLGAALMAASMLGGCGGAEGQVSATGDARDDEVTAETVADASGAPDLTEASEAEVAEATEAAAPADDMPVQQDHSTAEGASGTNPAKLAWALDNRFVVGRSDEELYSAEDVEDETDTVFRVVDQFAEGCDSYANLYRESGGFAKLGSRRFSSRSAAASAGRGSNFISVVGLKRRAS